MTGTLFGVGLGPGDPDLITRKAARLIREAEVIAYPEPLDGSSFARSIAESLFAEDVIEVPVSVPLQEERFPAQEVYRTAAAEIKDHLDSGTDVIVLCQGDPFFYGSFMYLFVRLAEGYRAEVVPGCVFALSLLRGRAAAALRPHGIPHRSSGADGGRQTAPPSGRRRGGGHRQAGPAYAQSQAGALIARPDGKVRLHRPCDAAAGNCLASCRRARSGPIFLNDPSSRKRPLWRKMKIRWFSARARPAGNLRSASVLNSVGNLLIPRQAAVRPAHLPKTCAARFRREGQLSVSAPPDHCPCPGSRHPGQTFRAARGLCGSVC